MEVYENLDLNDLENEIWKEIEGYNGDYQVSNKGRVKSFKRYHGTYVRILKPNKDRGGYLRVKLSKNGEKPKTIRIHILMYETHIEKIPEGCIIHHIDFTKNNYLNNFQMMTKEEHLSLHHKDKISPMRGKKRPEHSELMKGENHPMYGTKRPGEKSGHHTLTEQKVINIRIDLDEGILNQREIAEKFGVHSATISYIKNRKLWKHI